MSESQPEIFNEVSNSREYIVWYNHSRIKLRLLMSPSQYQETFKS